MKRAEHPEVSRFTQNEMKNSESHKEDTKALKDKKNKNKTTLSCCKRNIWNLQRRYRRFTEKVGRTSTTYGLLRV